METVVVTDSSAVAASFGGVRIVPIAVLLAEVEAPDGQVPVELVQSALRRHEPVKTRAPSIVDYVEAIETEASDAAVVITPAREFTVMWRNACNAVYLADRPVAVVDSRTAAVGQALVVDAAQRCAAGGGTLADVVAAAEDASRRARLIATVGSVDPITTSGILPSPTVAGLEAAVDQPLFRLDGGRVEVVRLAAAGTDPAVALAELWREDGGPAGESAIVFGAPGDHRTKRLAALTGAASVQPLSPAMTVYTGADVLGLAWIAQE